MNECILCNRKKWKLIHPERRLKKAKITPAETACTGEAKRGKHAKIWQCLFCGLIFQEPSFSQNKLGEAYKNSKDEEYFDQIKQRERLFKLSLNKIENYHKPPGRLLDVGSGPGLFVWLAQQSGWEARGLEPSKWASKEAKNRFGVRVASGLFEDINPKQGIYDVITMWDVLEHYFNPMEALVKARKLLKKEGVLVLTTINVDSWFSKFLGKYWPWLTRIHLWYFTPEALKKMLEKTGYRVERMGNQTRFFSFSYLVKRLTGRNLSWLPRTVVPAPTGDIIFTVARKVSKEQEGGMK